MQLGAMHSASYATDPKHLAFVLARYNFVARMLQGAKSVLEVGCGDMTGAPIVKAVVGKYLGIDIDSGYHGDYRIHDMTCGPLLGAKKFGAIFALDVLEHIAPDDEDAFFGNINKSLDEYGTVIMGAPSLESQPYASKLSKQHHVNCKTESGLRETLQKHYHNTYLFGMNDSTLHTGYGPFCHYRLAIANNPK